MLYLEDLKVLKCSPYLPNNVKICQDQLRLIIETYFVLPYMGVAADWSNDLKQSKEYRL